MGYRVTFGVRRKLARLFASADGNRQRSCARKVRYSKESAQRAALSMQEKTGDRFDVYECVHCGGWHIGHSAAGVTLRIEVSGDDS